MQKKKEKKKKINKKTMIHIFVVRKGEGWKVLRDF